jgi:rhamnulokinase
VAVHSYLAFDLGASSGRTILGTLDGGRLAIRELTRFPNEMVDLGGRLHWNIVQLYQEVKRGMQACASQAGVRPESVALDTWGVDFGLLASDGSLVGLPFAYRDPATRGAPERFFQKVPRRRVYELTGIQVMQINSLFQLYAMVRDGWPLLRSAEALLMIPDLLNYLLTGEKKEEFTIATTSQLYNPRKQDWEEELFAALGIPRRIMQQIVPPGTVIGPLLPAVGRETGLEGVPVMATTAHDTASAVAAVPAEGEDWAYISSGTWSLVGVESEQPIITEQAQEANVTNEGGVSGTFRVLKNVSGLWMVQECRRRWARERLYSYEELAQMAASAPAFTAVIDPDHGSFLNPPDMPEAIARYCQETGQNCPEAPAAMVRGILESLALKYRMVVEQLRQVWDQPIRRLHIIGGGSQNETLSQFAANATGLPVIAGPAEATAIGNLLVQAMGMGHLKSRADLRQIVRESFPMKRYEPRDTAAWEAAYQRFQEVRGAPPRPA